MVIETLQGLYTLWTYEFIHNIYRVLVGVSTTYCGIHIFTLFYRVKPSWKFTSGRRK